MRKLKLQMQISLDGFVSTGPNDDQTWVTWALEDIFQDVWDLSNSTDTILIGRKLAVDYIPFWQETYKKPNDPMFAFADQIVNAKKIVFTKTLEKSIWENTEIAKGDLVQEVNYLKSQTGKDIIVYGGTSFVSSLVENNLIDEYYFYVNPVVLGKGESIFGKLKNPTQLNLLKTKKYNCGINLSVYKMKG